MGIRTGTGDDELAPHERRLHDILREGKVRHSGDLERRNWYENLTPILKYHCKIRGDLVQNSQTAQEQALT